MNNGLFRLVFSKHLNMLVPASEATRSHVHKSSGTRLRSKQRALIALLISTAGILPAYAGGPAGLVADNPAGWTNAQINAAMTNANQMTITQLQAKAIVNWQQFMLNRGEILNIQDQASWSMLHRIGGMDPSVINGIINAKGHQYFYNANGIIFGGDAQINVGSLTATTLNVTDDLFLAGINSVPGLASFLRADGDTRSGFVKVEQGAHLTAASGGRVMLLAENVENKGVISTPDGQTILAAGKKVYLLDSTDPAGLLVEVDSGGTAANLGDIVAQRGNVTMVGLAVNQQGRINATTSVRANGSIHLLARDGIGAEKKVNGVVVGFGDSKRNGTVTLGKNSVTQVSTELADKEEVLDKQAFTPSRVKIEGRNIDIEGSIKAKGGDVIVTAKVDALDVVDPLAIANRIYLGKSASIDVSGEDAVAPMSRNQLVIQLFSEQLKDTPILRDSPLFGQTVYVDARKGTSLTDIQPFLDLKGRTVAEKLSEGGTVSLNAGVGEVIVRDGAKVDVSGGSVTYESGYIKETSLQYNGKLVPISQANKSTPYEGTSEQYIVKDPKWGVTRVWTLSSSPSGRYSEGYVDGADAGKVSINGADVVLDGAFVGNTKAGSYQRESAPDGATLVLTVSNLANVTQNAQKLAATFGVDDELDSVQKNETAIDTSLLRNGFNHLEISASGTKISSTLKTDANGSVKITGGAQVNADIVVPSGDITINGPTVLANGSKLSSSGLWSNDRPGLPNALSAPVATDAGTIVTENLVIGTGSLLEANAGGWMTANGKIQKGKAGNITVGNTSGNLNFQAYGFDKGGSFTLKTDQNIQVGGSNSNLADTFWLAESFFGQGGFSSYNLKTITPDASFVIGDSSGRSTVIAPLMQTLQMQSGISGKASGSAIMEIAQPVLALATLRKPVSLAFSAFNNGDEFGNLTLLENTVIRLDTPNSASDKASVTLEAGGRLSILGSIVAPSGDINLKLSGGPGNNAYVHTHGIYLGENSRLLATGSYVVAPNNANNLQGAKVLDAGSISVTAAKGAVVAKEGSLLDVSGTTGQVDIKTNAGFSRQTLSSDAGKITVSSRDALVLDGDLKGHASGTASGGTLSLALTGKASDAPPAIQYPSGSREFTVTQNKQISGAVLQAGDALDSIVGKAQVSVAQIQGGGFDRLSIASGLERAAYTGEDKIILQSGTDLNAATAIELATPVVEVSGNGEAKVSSSYVGFTSNVSQAGTSNALPLTQGNATLTVNADLIDLNGKLAINGVNTTNLNSRLDIRGRGIQPGTDFTATTGGWLATTGELNLTARQIYPVTNSAFRFDAQGTNSQINVQSNGLAAKPVLSAGGRLLLKADEINQGGVLLAPLGQIELEATNKVTLANNSLTSVSADGSIIPYGITRLGGLEWYLSKNDFQEGKLTTALAAKRVSIKAPEVVTKNGSTLDISGGGDTLAYEWIPGIGGSQDILGQPGVYAVIPGMQGEYASFDYNYQTGTDLKAGDAVYLSGIPGLAAGVYTLLPGRYALLPGAYMVQANSTSLAQGKQIQKLDGSSLTSGYRTTVNSASRDADWSTFQVTSGNVFRPAKGEVSHAPAEYLLTSGNQYFNDKAVDAGVTIPRLASDAGQLVLDASQKLVLDGNLKTSKKAGARGALVDIVADNIKVVSATGAADGTLQVTAQSLANLQAESLLLGGSRSQTDAGFSITTGANTVTFANDATHPLAVTELFAAAKDKVTVLEGASIATLASTQTKGNTKVSASGDGALLAVSGLNEITYDRSGVSASPTQGTLDIRNGANIQAGRSLVLDATKAAELKGNINVAEGGSATLGANRVLLGDSGSEAGLQLDNDLLISLGALSKVTLNSYQNVDVYGPVTFGNDKLDITINAGGIAGHMGSGESASLTANNLILKNSTGAVFVPAASATASQIDLIANNVVFEGKNPALTGLPANAGKTVIGGFDTVNIDAKAEVLFTGSGDAQIQANTTNISSTRISADSRTDYQFAATGDLTTTKTAAPATLTASTGLGAKLDMVASGMILGGDITLASGKFLAQATSGDLNVASGANIKAASIPVVFDQYTEHTPGGKITLRADMADVNVAANATLDVSGGVNANAGEIVIIAKNGNANIAGNLNGQAANGKRSGSFTLDAKTLADFSTLNTVLNTGNFNALRDMRIRTGDVVIATGDEVVAENVVLSTDAGSITVNGGINAQALNGGSITLNGGQNVTLNNGALLNAKATKAGAAGGDVNLASRSGVLDLKAGSAIDVSGGAGGDGGAVLLRTSRTGAGSGTGVAVAALDSTITGSDSTVLEGVRVFNLTGPNTTVTTGSANTTTSLGYTTIANDVSAFMSSKDAIVSTLGKTGDATFHLRAGTEVRATGNLTVASDWNLYSASRAGNEPGSLTLRAANNLSINGSINDGFATAATTAALGEGESWSYRMVAGADTSAANVLATSKDAGNFSLANAKLIRTGTGDIDIASGGNITMGNESSVIYTAGRSAEVVTDFSAPATARYLAHGGDLRISAAGDIVGKVASGSAQQMINHWLFRQGGGSQNKDVSWWVRPDLFKQGVAAFGGGDIAIKADGNITNFSASIPTTGRYVYEKVAAVDANGNPVTVVNYNHLLDSAVDGGGQLSVVAGGDIQSGIYYVGRGNIHVNAGDEVTAATGNMGTVIALQDASANVSATNGAFLETVFNPTLWAQSTTNVVSGVANATGDSAFFSTYGADSKLNLTSITGNARLGLYQAKNIEDKAKTGLSSIASSQLALSFHPSSVSATAFNGDINVGDLILTPAQSGNLKLLATGSLFADRIVMSDAEASLLPTVSSPLAGGIATGNPLDIYPDVFTNHAKTPVHIGDASPVVIVARDGSMIGRSNTSSSGVLDINLPKAAYIKAGIDIKNLKADLQNVSSADTTVIGAGRDLILQDAGEGVVLAGPGNLLVKTGRNIDLGESKGIQTSANTKNSALSATGASITLAAGLGAKGANVAEYIAAYIAPGAVGPSVLQGDTGKLAQYRADTTSALTAYMKQLTGDGNLSDVDAMTRYLVLNEDKQAVFAYRHFSSELLASGKGFAASQSHARGDTAIAKLFANGGYDGDVLMYNSQVVTARDGSIDIVAPGGLINAGVPGASAEDVGIVTEKGGAIRAFSDAGFLVNQSKVITQFGSDITVWVNNGDIDAGRGSKTALSVPERVVTTDVDGKTTIEYKGVAAGSGIRAQTYDPDGTDGAQGAPTLGSVALIAPRGVLNAGEAGIAAGNFLAVATQVIGANNISVSGTSTGVPVADTGSLAGSLGGLSNVGADATKSATEDVTRQLAQSAVQDFVKKNFMPSIISVEVIGLGDL